MLHAKEWHTSARPHLFQPKIFEHLIANRVHYNTYWILIQVLSMILSYKLMWWFQRCKSGRLDPLRCIEHLHIIHSYSHDNVLQQSAHIASPSYLTQNTEKFRRPGTGRARSPVIENNHRSLSCLIPFFILIISAICYTSGIVLITHRIFRLEV